MSIGPLSPMQMFSARQLLHWTRKDLAKRISVQWQAIRAFEVEGVTSNGFDAEKAQETLEAAGVEFTNGRQPSVKLRKHTPVSVAVEN